MEGDFKGILWLQFGAAIDMLENAIDACPEEVWSDPSKRPEWASHDVVGFWYLVYHTLFFLDLEHDRRKFREVISALDEKDAFERRAKTRPDLSVAELFLYSMRHVQHHTAQLNLILRQRTDSAPPGWVSRARAPLGGAKAASV